MKKEDRIQFNKDLIKKTAQKLFGDKGFAETTMDDIAREGAYSKSTLYVYYESKDAIFYNIVLDYMLLLKEEITNCFDPVNSFSGHYHAICDTLVGFEEKYPLYFEALLGEIAVTDAEKKKLPVLQDLYYAGEEINCLLEQRIKNACENQEIQLDLPIAETVFTLWASIGGIIRMSRKKESYLKEKMKVSRGEYLSQGFHLLYRTIAWEEKV